MAGLVATALLPLVAAAQFPPTVVTRPRPALRRDQTQRALHPKIIQYEDERLAPTELIDMLSLPSGPVRRRAIVALGRIGDPNAVGALIARLTNDKNPEMRMLAAFALGEIESHEAAPDLLARLDATTEPSAGVRARAAEALGKIASNKYSAEALGKFGLGAIKDALIQVLPEPAQAPSEDARLVASVALTALLRIKQPGTVEPIAAQLRSPSAQLRWQAANALARIREGIAVAVPALLPLTADKDSLARAHAARALAVAGDKSAVESLIRLLGDIDERVVASAINALGTLDDPRAVGPLIDLGSRLLAAYRAFDRNRLGVPTQQNLLLLIATALGNLKDARSLPFLKSLRTADGRLGSSPEVETAVAKFGESAFFDAPEAVTLARDDWKAVAAYAQGLGVLGSERARSLLKELLAGTSLTKTDPRAVSDILTAMKQAKVEGLGQILVEQLKAQDVIVRSTAATLLGELGDASDGVVKALGDAYKAAREDVMNDARIAILEALDKLKRPMSIQVLSEPNRDPDYVVRRRAAELLRDAKEEGVLVKFPVGKVETGHDRTYWKRIAQLAAAPKNPIALIRTKKGDIRIELLASDAPMTVDNFIQLSKRGFYDGLTLMRVVPNFVIQGGDPRNDMNGGPGYQIRCEINLRQYGVGAVGMALSGKDTGGSQFFITHSPQPHLDGGYTIFGQVISGMDAVNRIARGDRIEKVEIIEQR